MPTLSIGDAAPLFKAKASGRETVALKDLQGQYVVLYFYPKDDTPGCTKEACQFRDDFPKFSKSSSVILGVSKDSAASHDKFVTKYELPFTLISDEDGKICDAYGTWVEKSMYGRKYMGIERSTFLIDPEGKILRIWPKVKVDGHAAEVLTAIRQDKDKKKNQTAA